jgi:hypothetical protein
VDGDSGDLVPEELALARVQACPNLEPEALDGVTGGDGAADGARRAVEAREEAVAGGVDLPSAEALQLAPYDRVVAPEQLGPACRRARARRHLTMSVKRGRWRAPCSAGRRRIDQAFDHV